MIIIDNDGIIDEADRWDALTLIEQEQELRPIRKQLRLYKWMR